jgi:hypothetical protein
MIDTHHHDADRVVLVVPAELGVQATLVRADPGRFFVPPYVGWKGWVGVRIDGAADWAAIEELLVDAHALIALVLGGRGDSAAPRQYRDEKARLSPPLTRALGQLRYL